MSKYKYGFRYQDTEVIPLADVLAGKATPHLDPESPTLVARLTEDDDWEPVDVLLDALVELEAGDE